MNIKTLLLAAAMISPLHAEEAPAPKKAEALQATELIKKMSPHLIDAEGKPVSTDLAKGDYLLVYWSASWCGPCRKFTPQLVEYYNENGGGKDFEIVLIGLDKTEKKMMSYIANEQMPWPAVSFDEKYETGAKSFAKGGIPRLMIIDKKGEVIDRGNAYSMLRKFKTLREEDSK